jgi:hypothetical protein
MLLGTLHMALIVRHKPRKGQVLSITSSAHRVHALVGRKDFIEKVTGTSPSSPCIFSRPLLKRNAHSKSSTSPHAALALVHNCCGVSPPC